MRSERLAHFGELRIWDGACGCVRVAPLIWRKERWNIKLKSLARPAIAIAPETSVIEAIDLMLQENVRANAIAREGVMIGIFTLRDVARKVVQPNRDPASTRVDAVMTNDIKFAASSTDVRDATRIMLNAHIDHLPVVDEDGQIAGVVSFQHLLRDKINGLVFEVESLSGYIQGNGYM